MTIEARKTPLERRTVHLERADGEPVQVARTENAIRKSIKFVTRPQSAKGIPRKLEYELAATVSQLNVELMLHRLDPVICPRVTSKCRCVR